MSANQYSIMLVDDETDILDALYDTFIDKYKVYKANSAAASCVKSRSTVTFLTLSPSHPKNMLPNANPVINVTRTIVKE